LIFKKKVKSTAHPPVHIIYKQESVLFVMVDSGNSWARITGTEQLILETRTGQPGQDRKDRAARNGQPGQDRQDRLARMVQQGEDCQDRTASL
jgi:hypothetical protein